MLKIRKVRAEEGPVESSALSKVNPIFFRINSDIGHAAAKQQEPQQSTQPLSVVKEGKRNGVAKANHADPFFGAFGRVTKHDPGSVFGVTLEIPPINRSSGFQLPSSSPR